MNLSSTDRVEAAFAELQATWEAERLAHAYIIAAPPRGAGTDLAIRLIQLLACEGMLKPCGDCTACNQAAAKHHPDSHWIEPESKSRVIQVKQMRNQVNIPMHRTSYVGGWKVAVILYADRMNPAAANAFLKTLEEPPPKTLLLLLTDSVQMLLPTIRSRCHFIPLAAGTEVAGGDWLEPLLDVLREGAPRDVVGAIRQAAGVVHLLKTVREDIKEGAADEWSDVDEIEPDVLDARIESRVREVQEDFLKALLYWFRDVAMGATESAPDLLYYPEDAEITRAQGHGLTWAAALEGVSAVEECTRQLTENFSPTTAFEALFRRIGRAWLRAG